MKRQFQKPEHLPLHLDVPCVRPLATSLQMSRCNKILENAPQALAWQARCAYEVCHCRLTTKLSQHAQHLRFSAFFDRCRRLLLGNEVGQYPTADKPNHPLSVDSELQQRSRLDRFSMPG